MFSNIPKIGKQLIAGDKIKEKYSKLKNKSKSKQVTQKDTDDLCPICLEDLENGEELDYCKFSCGKPVHTECYKMWLKKKAAKCIYCQANWHTEKTNYINLL